jgi:serine/threonine protein phosphatase 1
MPQIPKQPAAPRVIRLPLNERGRDWVVGDIHGAYDLVWTAMKAAGFDPKHDRLFSLGDLVDRGPGSARCLEFLAQPYVHAVRGNHDDDLASLDSTEEIQVLGAINFQGMGWVREQSAERLVAISRRLSQLPIVIEVQTRRGLVGLVHADVPGGMHWADFVAKVEAGDAATIECALRSRARADTGDARGVPGLYRVFAGHTISWDGPRKLGNVYNIDTGAVFAVPIDPARPARGSLTMINLGALTGPLVTLHRHPDIPALRLCAAPDEVSSPEVQSQPEPATGQGRRAVIRPSAAGG